MEITKVEIEITEEMVNYSNAIKHIQEMDTDKFLDDELSNSIKLECFYMELGEILDNIITATQKPQGE